MKAGRLIRCSSGAAAVEFAIVFLPLAMLAFGAMEFGRAMWLRHEIAAAVGAAERSLLLSREEASAAARRAEGVAMDSFGLDTGLLAVTVMPGVHEGVRYMEVRAAHPVTLMIPGFPPGPFSVTLERRIQLP